MRQVLFPLTALAASLAGCSQPSSTPAQDSAASDPSAAASAPPPGPGAPSIVSPATAAAIPERFRGVWDNIKGSCNPSSDLRMEIGAVSIEFYESLGTVTGVIVESPDSIVIDLAMEGEGERWTVKNRFVLSDDGATLTPAEADGTPSTPMPRKRCPN